MFEFRILTYNKDEMKKNTEEIFFFTEYQIDALSKREYKQRRKHAKPKCIRLI